MSEEKNIVEFKCEIENCVFQSDNWSIYAAIPKFDSVDVSDKDIFSESEVKDDGFKYNKYNNITLVGNLPSLDLYQEYTIKADVTNDPNYGWQYKVITLHRDVPASDAATRDFLASILTYDQCSVVLEVYPDVVNMVIDGNEKEIDVTKLHNIGEFRKGKMIDKIQENYVYMDLLSEFKDFDLSLSTVKALFTKHGSSEKVKQVFYKDPYKFLMDMDRIGFKRADDKILRKMPELKSSYIRCKAYFDKYIMDMEGKGHTIISLPKLEESVRENIIDSYEYFDEVQSDERFKKIKNFIMRKETFDKELYIAQTLIDMQYGNELRVWDYDFVDINKDKEFPATLEQIAAMNDALINNVSMLFAIGGSGKSFAMKTLLDVLDELNKTSLWLAPTGRASKVLSDYIGRGASTIHRGLAYNPSQSPKWGYNENSKLNCDIVIIDEGSMIDVDLMYRLCLAIDPSVTKLFIVGDDYQIPSVGKGNVAYDMLRSTFINVSRLTKVFRYKAGGMAKVLDDMRLGKVFFDRKTLKEGVNTFGEDKDYVLIKTPQEKSSGTILSIYNKMILQGVPHTDIMITMTMNVHEHGAIKINKMIQKYLLDKTKLLDKNRNIKSNGMDWYVGDIVMQTSNDYKAEISESLFESSSPFVGEVFNGSVGKIIDIQRDKALIEFDGVKLVYTKSKFYNLLLGYAVNIYKLQGGQAPYIILSTPKAHTFNMNKNLMYTGGSRAKKRLFHITDIDIILSALSKSATFERDTLLGHLLKKVYLDWSKEKVVKPYVEKEHNNRNHQFGLGDRKPPTIGKTYKDSNTFRGFTAMDGDDDIPF